MDTSIQQQERITSGRRPRVVYLDHVARLSGAEIALSRLLDAVRDDVEAHVILAEDGPLVARLSAAGAAVEVLPMADRVREARKGEMTGSRPPWGAVVDLARYIWVLRARLRQLEPDLVHTNSLKAAIYGGLAARLAGRRLVWHIRDRIASDYLPRAAVLGVRGLSRLLPHRILANSVTTLATLPPSARTSVLYNALTPADALAPARSGTVRSEGVPGEALTVAMVGRIAPWKGHDILLRAFATAFAGGPQRLHVIGDAMFGEESYADGLRSLAATLEIEKQVVWRGFRSDVAAELALVDVLVHCSTTPEPFGSVVVEGMLAGLPVVAAADGGPVEIIDTGRDGLLVPPGDVAALAQALNTLDRDPELRQRLGRAAVDVAARFSPERARASLLEAYTKVLA